MLLPPAIYSKPMTVNVHLQGEMPKESPLFTAEHISKGELGTENKSVITNILLKLCTFYIHFIACQLHFSITFKIICAENQRVSFEERLSTQKTKVSAYIFTKGDL